MPKFTWDKWDFDLDGEAYVIRKDVCPNREDIPDFIISVDNLLDDCKQGIIDGGIQEGWCRFQISKYWADVNEPISGYEVRMFATRMPKHGWFPVWIVRLGEWY